MTVSQEMVDNTIALQWDVDQKWKKVCISLPAELHIKISFLKIILL
jgi:hypothetical protein